MEVIQEVKYLSNDGKKFDNVEECMSYECGEEVADAVKTLRKYCSSYGSCNKTCPFNNLSYDNNCYLRQFFPNYWFKEV
jgi:flavoprotein